MRRRRGCTSPALSRARRNARHRPPRPGSRAPGPAVRGMRRAAGRRPALLPELRRAPRACAPGPARARAGLQRRRRATPSAPPAAGAAGRRATAWPLPSRRVAGVATLLMLGFGVAAGAAAGPARRRDARLGQPRPTIVVAAARGRRRPPCSPPRHPRRRSPSASPPADTSAPATSTADSLHARTARRPTTSAPDSSSPDSSHARRRLRPRQTATRRPPATRRPRPRRRRSSTSGSSR